MNTISSRAGSVCRVAGLVVLHDDGLELPVLADQLAHLGVQVHLDARIVQDPVGQVARHVLVEAASPAPSAGPPGVVGEEQRGLARRVAAADHGDWVARAQLRLDRVAA